MSKELEERIKRQKKMITDFAEISEKIGMSHEERDKRINILLDDLKRLMNEED